MTIVLVLTIGLTLLTVAFHVLSLRILSRILFRLKAMPVVGLSLIIACAILAHLLEIGFFSAGYYVLDNAGQYGDIGEGPEMGGLNFFFVSAQIYTSLGFTDNAPTGPLRLMAVFEAVAGLVLITWTASLGYSVMHEQWLALVREEAASNRPRTH